MPLRNLFCLDFLREQFQKDPSLAVSSSCGCCKCPCVVSEKFPREVFFWNKYRDDPIRLLHKRLKRFFHTMSTRATYAVAWNKYKEYTLLNGYSTIPVTFETLVNWIAHLSELNRPESIRQYIAAIRSHLIDRGQSTAALDDPRISRMIKGALRIHGIQPVRERLEITKDILLKMLATIDSSTLNNLNIYASFCVAFAGFCRPSEVTWEQ